MKPSCREIDALLTPYVDGEAGGEDREAVEAHLAVCPPCRSRAAAEQTIRDVVRDRSARLVERAPSGLRARCIAAGAPALLRSTGASRWRSWLGLSIAATAVLAAGAIGWFARSASLETAFAAQLIKDHQKCFVALGSAADALEAAEAEARLEQRYGWRMRVPESSSAEGLTLLDVRRCLYADGAVAHVLYELADRPVSLFIVPGAREADRVLEIMGHDALIWSGDENTYVLVGDPGSSEMTRLATYVRRFTN